MKKKVVSVVDRFESRLNENLTCQSDRMLDYAAALRFSFDYMFVHVFFEFSKKKTTKLFTTPEISNLNLIFNTLNIKHKSFLKVLVHVHSGVAYTN